MSADRPAHRAFVDQSGAHDHAPSTRVSGDCRDQCVLGSRRGPVHPVSAPGKKCAGRQQSVASLFLVVFSIGVALGSVSINHLLRGKASARYAPISIMAMAAFIVAFDLVCRQWPPRDHNHMLDAWSFVLQPLAIPLLGSLLGIAVAGGMFVVPLYAFLTTIVDKAETSRTIAANNIVNSFAMVIASVIAVSLSAKGVAIVHQLLLGAAMCTVSAMLSWRLYQVERAHIGEIEHTFQGKS